MDTFKQALLWIGIGAVTSPIWGALLWVLWEGRIRPRLIPGTEIEFAGDGDGWPAQGESGGDGLYRRGPGLALFAPFRARKVAAGAEAD